MVRPSRRDLLGSLGAAAGVCVAPGTAGCLSAPDDPGSTADGATRTPATTAPAADPTTDGTPADPIGIDIRSELDGAAQVDVTVTGPSGRVSTHVAEVPPGGRVRLDSGIDDVGEYAVAVDVRDGPEDETTVGIDDYDVAAGSNVVVVLRPAGIRFLIQE